jgi:hypothetical protein
MLWKLYSIKLAPDVQESIELVTIFFSEKINRTCTNCTISRWIAAMLSNRMVRAKIRGVSSAMMVRGDCPQGGVLSPLLWNMVINSLLVRLSNESLWAQGFADGIAIVNYGKFLSTVCEFMQKALFIVQTWCRGWGCLSMLIRHRWSFSPTTGI